MIHTHRPVLVTAVITAILSALTALAWVTSAHGDSASAPERGREIGRSASVTVSPVTLRRRR